MSDPIGKYLGLPPMRSENTESDNNSLLSRLERNIPKKVEQPQAQTIMPAGSRKDDADTDFDFARSNMYDAIDTGKQALSELLTVAIQSQNPRAYEVLATTVKTLVDASKQLADLSKEKAAEEKEPTQTETNVTNNNLFVGTTHDLLKVLADMKKKND
jgi:hypothetical protein